MTSDPVPGFPLELKKLRCWVVWEKDTKVPYSPGSGKAAKTTDPSTWTDFDTAISEHGYAGAGCVIAKPYAGIDLDKCRDPKTGAIEEWARAIIRELDSYTEVSPSGRGVHIWVKARLPKAGNRKGRVEMYDKERYFTVTGDHVEGTPLTIEARNLSALQDRMLLGALEASIATAQGSDMTESGEDFRRALALIKEMPGADAATIEVEFRKRYADSKRDKWDERRGDSSYLGYTIRKALQATKPTPAGPISDTCRPELALKWANTVETKKVQWLWRDRIPLGKLTILTGNPDQGKSLVTAYLAARVSTGGKWHDSENEVPASEVLMLSGEDDPKDTLVPRLQAAGANLSKIALLESVMLKDDLGKTVKNRGAQLDTDLELIGKTLRSNPGIRLVIIDPLSNYLGSANMNKEQQVRALLVPVQELAERAGVSIVCVMHLNKKSDLSAIHRIGGAVAFSGVSRAAWLFVADLNDKETHYMLRVKANIARPVGGLIYKISTKPIMIEGTQDWVPYVEWTGETDEDADDILTATPGKQPKKRQAAAEWLSDFLSNGKRSANEVLAESKKAKISEPTLQRAKGDIGVISKQEAGEWYWEAPRASTLPF